MTLHATDASRLVRNPAEAIDRLADIVGNDLVVGAPLGIGKPMLLLNDLYRRAIEDPSVRLHIITALTLEAPRAGSELERRLLDPISDRMYASWVDPAWSGDLRRGRLPDNVRISEFFFQPGAFVGVDHAQRWHINANYTDVARDCLHHGINVIAQLVAIDESGNLSLSSNPDVTLELLRHFALSESPTAAVAVVSRSLPFLGGDAVVDPDVFDIVLPDPAFDPEPFAVPAEPLSIVDHAIGLQAAALVPDGGTIQFGIGSLAEAVASALILRHTDPPAFRGALEATGALDRHYRLITEVGGVGPFETGLYACSEMLSDGLLALHDAGILRRRAYPSDSVQRMVDEGTIGRAVSPDTLAALHRSGVVRSPLAKDDLSLLRAIGLVGQRCRIEGATVVLPDGARIPGDLEERGTLERLVASSDRDELSGPVMHAAFFLGSSRFYDRLRRLDGATGDVNMTSVGFTNAVDHAFEVKAAQRRRARFVNQALKVTASGGIAAHALGDGRTLSGVGGQFDFVAMARRLPGARSVTLLPATHRRRGRVESNIVPSHPHATVPAQHRDLVVTEYGIADLRSGADGEVIEELIAVADARFSSDLVEHGRRTGRLQRGHRPPAVSHRNTPDHLRDRLEAFQQDGLLPEFPFGSDLTEVELGLARGLKALDAMVPNPLRSPPSLESLRAGWRIPESASPYLMRMGLHRPSGPKEALLQRAVAVGLVSAGVIEPD